MACQMQKVPTTWYLSAQGLLGFIYITCENNCITLPFPYEYAWCSQLIGWVWLEKHLSFRRMKNRHKLYTVSTALESPCVGASSDISPGYVQCKILYCLRQTHLVLFVEEATLCHVTMSFAEMRCSSYLKGKQLGKLLFLQKVLKCYFLTAFSTRWQDFNFYFLVNDLYARLLLVSKARKINEISLPEPVGENYYFHELKVRGTSANLCLITLHVICIICISSSFLTEIRRVFVEGEQPQAGVTASGILL